MVRPTVRQWVRCVAEELAFGSLFAVTTAWALAAGLATAALWAAGLLLVTLSMLTRAVLIDVPAGVWAAVWPPTVEGVRLALSPRRRAFRRRTDALRAWCRVTPAVARGVDALAAQIRMARGTPATAQELAIARQEKWAKDPRVQQELLALCAVHPDFEQAARKLLPRRDDNRPIRPDTARRMRRLWMEAWTYRELSEATAATAAPPTPDERKARSEGDYRAGKAWGAGLACAALWLTVFRQYPDLTVVLTGGVLVFGSLCCLYLNMAPPAPQPGPPPEKEKKHEPTRRPGLERR